MARSSREDVGLAVLQIVGEDGLEAVTMRRVGELVGVNAMSLYGTYVVDKDDVWQAAVERIVAPHVAEQLAAADVPWDVVHAARLKLVAEAVNGRTLVVGDDGVKVGALT